MEELSCELPGDEPGSEVEGGSATECQAKGVWLVTARRVLLDRHGEEGLQRVVSALGPECSRPLLEPFASAWYPEVTLQQTMSAVSFALYGQDPERFCSFIEACTVVGINRFMRVLLALTSPSYVLSKMPVFWTRHRRNNGQLTVDVAGRTARLHYRGFPFFADPNYRIFVRGILSKTMEISSGERPEVTVRDYGRDWLAVDVFFPTLRLS